VRLRALRGFGSKAHVEDVQVRWLARGLASPQLMRELYAKGYAGGSQSGDSPTYLASRQQRALLGLGAA
jgi:hypothetical protein